MRKYKFTINGNPYAVTIKKLTEDQGIVEVNGTEYNVEIVEEPAQRKTPQLIRSQAVPDSRSSSSRTKSMQSASTSGAIKAPLPGLILEVIAKEGDDVNVGQTILKMEAMKMENNVQAPRAGVITSIKVKQGDSVLEGDILVEIGG